MAKTFNISFPPDLARKVDREAKREDRSRSELFRVALHDYIGRKERWEEVVAPFRAEAKRRGYKPSGVNRWIAEYRQSRKR